VFEDKRAIINQRELGFDTMGFEGALRSALRQDPDVILVGEMRDHITIKTVMHAAETGHLVFSTMHTVDATESVNRIVQMFPREEQTAIRLNLAAILRGVVSQRLLPRADGRGMIPAVEVLINTPRVQEMISDPMRTHELVDAIREGANPYGMVTFDQSLMNMVRRKLVTYEVALAASTNPADFELAFRGVSGGTEQQVAEDDVEFDLE
jgi:twitching motility protein PilT